MPLRLAAVAAAYLGLAVLWAAPSSLRPAQAAPDLGDPLHLGWTMAWNAHQLVRQPGALFEANAFHPYRSSLAFSDHLLPETLMVVPVLWTSGNPVLAYNLAVLAGLTLSALAMFLLVRHLTGSDAAAFLAGLAYAFNSFTQHELLRVQVLHLEWWPLAWLFLDRFARAPRTRDALGAAAALALQGLSGTYYLAYTLMLLPLWLGVAFLAHRRRPTARDLVRLLAALAAAAVPVALILRPILRQYRWMGVAKGWAGGADLLSYVDPGPRNWLWGAFDHPGLASELPHFLGFAGLVLMAVGVACVLRDRERGPARAGAWLALATAAAGLLLSLGPLVHVGGRRLFAGVYEWLWRLVPPARAMASPERSGALVLLGGAVLLGVGVAALLPHLPRRVRALAVAAAALFLPLEHWSVPRAAAEVPTGADVPQVFRWLAAQPPQPLIELPLFPERNKKLWALYLHFSTVHWQRIPIGRASFYPPAHDMLAWGLRGFPDETALALLDRLGIRTLIVHPGQWAEGERAERLAALDSHPRLVLRRAFEDVPSARVAALGLGRERVYELRPGAPAAPPCTPADEIARAGWSLDSSGVNKPERATDGDAATAWFTAQPQRPGDRLDVALPAPETVAAVAVDLAYPFDEFGRNLVLLVRGEEGPWRRVPYADGPEERWDTVRALVERPRQAHMVMRIAPERVRAVRLMVGYREDEPAWPRWSVHELRLFRRCEGGLTGAAGVPTVEMRR